MSIRKVKDYFFRRFIEPYFKEYLACTFYKEPPISYNVIHVYSRELVAQGVFIPSDYLEKKLVKGIAEELLKNKLISIKNEETSINGRPHTQWTAHLLVMQK